MKLKTTILLLMISAYVFGQGIIPITETTLQLGYDETKEVYYSFEEGDQILFNLHMVQGKHIREIEIVELPGNTVFSAFKANEIIGKKIKVRRRGVYKFRFYSSSLTNRACKYTIHRIPTNESTRNFNTNWEWAIQRDTTYTSYQQDSLIGHETIKYQETIKELKEEKLEEIMLFEKSETVHSFYNQNISRTYLRVNLPLLHNTPLREERIVAWSYWIGVGQEARKAYQENVATMTKILEQGANTYYQTPLAGIAIGAISRMITPSIGEDVKYYFLSDHENAQKFYNKQPFLQFDMGKGRAAYGRNDTLRQGSFYIGLLNDNEWRGIEVDVKILVIKEIKTFENVTYNREKENPQYLTLNKTRMHIEETKIRVPAN